MTLMAVSDDELVIIFSPPLVTLLLAAERQQGRPLTERQVIDLRDDATCLRVPLAVAEAMEQERGYADLDPERCWDEWLAVRAELIP